MKVYALTGGIASGKSEASRRFAQLGIPVIDADLVAHGVMEPGGRAYDAVVAHFGKSILTEGKIDRGLLGAKVFDNPQELARLNALVHPTVQLEIARRLAEYVQSAEIVIVDAALHAENGKLGDGMAGLVFVHAPEQERVRRMVECRRLSPQEARKRIAAQSNPERKIALADWVIENSGTLDGLYRQVDAIAREMRE